MNYAIHFVEGPEDVHVETSGRGTLTGFCSFIGELTRDPRFRPGMSVLVDHSRLDAGALRTADAKSFSAALAGMDELGAAVLVCVAPSDLMFGISRAFEAFAEAQGITARVFRSVDEARAWLASGAER